MEEEKLDEKIKEFLEEEYEKIVKALEKGKPSIVFNYRDLDNFEPELADILLDNPTEFIENLEKQITELVGGEAELRVRFTGLPTSSELLIKDIRSKHIGKFLSINGLVRLASEVRPVSAIIVFSCPACGAMIKEKQDASAIKQPRRCINCGRTGKFDVHSKKMVDTQRLVIEEIPEELQGGEQPQRISMFLQDDLVEPQMVKRTVPGAKIRTIGMVNEVPIYLKGGSKSTRFDLIIQANNIESLEKEFEELDVSKEEEKEIIELASKPDIYEKFINSIAPTIWGYREIKEAIVLQMFSGVRKTRPDGTVSRGDMHILLVGDPGVAKSQMLKYVTATAPKARYVSGKGATGAGLTAAVVKDEFLRGWALEAGALVLASGGICCIDEIDKMNKDDRVAMHEAMEQQTISISKANIQATLRAETSILSAANPELGRFDPYKPIAEQIDLPPTLINRFDLIFTIRDIPSRETDEKIAGYVLDTMKDPEKRKPEMELELMKKYISYAKRNYEPMLTKEAINEIKNFYVTLRNKGVSGGETIRPIPISPRQLEALIRLSEASAKVRLDKKVRKIDAKRAIKLVRYYLKQVGMDPETGEIDIDRIVTGITATQRSRIIQIREVIADMEKTFGENIPIEEIMNEAIERGTESAKVEEIIDKMMRDGEIFQPKHGFIRRTH